MVKQSRKRIELFTVQAAGRTLAQRNADRLVNGVVEILKVLIDAGLMEEQSIEQMLGAPGDSKKPVKAESEQALNLDPVAAAEGDSNFKVTVARVTWNDRLRDMLRIFAPLFSDFLGLTDETLKQRYAISEGRDESVQELVGDLIDLLQDLSNDSPGPRDGGDYYPSSYPYDYDYPVYLSAKPEKEDAARPEQENVAAADSSFKDTVKRATWANRVGDTLRIFCYRFSSMHDAPDSELRSMGIDGDRAAGVTALLSDLKDLLTALAVDHPGAGQRTGYISLELSASAEGGAVNRLEEVVFEISARAAVVVADESADDEDLTTLNRRPIEGVLFRVDEPSESIPSVGPGLPLYIPREVAVAAMHSVSGLPLDADDSLTCHANEDITGVMMSGEVIGKEALMRGVLWPWSQSKKVAAIALAKDRLGMSINGVIAGHEQEIEVAGSSNRTVFWVDTLVLLGANILYAERATYKQTRIVAATGERVMDTDPTPTAPQASDPSITARIPSLLSASETLVEPDGEVDPSDAQEAAQLSHDLDLQEDDMAIDPALQEQLNGITTSLQSLSGLADVVGSLSTNVTSIHSTVTNLTAAVNEIQAERQQVAAAAQQQQQQLSAQQQQEDLRTFIAQTIQSSLPDALTAAVNPSRQPARISAPLPLAVQASNNAATQQTQQDSQRQGLERELISAEARLQELRTRPMADGAREVSLTEQIRNIKATLGVA